MTENYKQKLIPGKNLFRGKHLYSLTPKEKNPIEVIDIQRNTGYTDLVMKMKFKKLFFITGLLIIGLAVLTWGISCLWGIYCFHSVKNQKNEQGISRWAELEQNVLSRPAGTNLFDLSPWKEWLEAKIADPASSGDGELSKWKEKYNDFSALKNFAYEQAFYADRFFFPNPYPHIEDFSSKEIYQRDIEEAEKSLNAFKERHIKRYDEKLKQKLAEENKELTDKDQSLYDRIYKNSFKSIEYRHSIMTKADEFDQKMGSSEEYKKLSREQQTAQFFLSLLSEGTPFREKIKGTFKTAKHESLPVSGYSTALGREYLDIKDSLIDEAGFYAITYAILGEREKVLDEIDFILNMTALEPCASSVEYGSNCNERYVDIRVPTRYHILTEEDLINLQNRLEKIHYVKSFQKNLEGEVYQNILNNDPMFYTYYSKIDYWLKRIFYGKFKRGEARYLQYFWDIQPLIHVQEQTIDVEQWNEVNKPYIQLYSEMDAMEFDSVKDVIKNGIRFIHNADSFKVINDGMREFDDLKKHYNYIYIERNKAITVCALERYFLKNKHYPETLRELVPEYIESLPVSEMEPYSDKEYLFYESDGESYSFNL